MRGEGLLEPHLRPRFLWTRRFDRLGPEAEVSRKAWIHNRGRLVAGARFRLSSVPVESHIVVGHGGSLEIGDDVVVGHGAAIVAQRSVRIGAGSRIGPFCAIADTDFHVAGQRERKPEESPIDIGRAVRLGARVTVLRGAVIGDGATVESGSVVSGTVPPGARVGGVPARSRSGGPRGAEGGDDVSSRVAAALARALGLAEAPPAEREREAVPGWDSLGALMVLLALEEEFAVTLDEAKVPYADSVADLARLVEAAL